MKAENITGAMIAFNVGNYTGGFEDEKDVEVLDAVRARMLNNLDRNIGAMDAARIPVKPELQQLIDKVTHPKLKVMLKEFQDMQASQPNSASIVLRTIICLTIKIRAQKTRPELAMAKDDELEFTPYLNKAIDEKLFDSGDIKYIKNFRDGNLRDMFDNITHKDHEKWLIKDNDELKPGIELITKLLYAIT